MESKSDMKPASRSGEDELSRPESTGNLDPWYMDPLPPAPGCSAHEAENDGELEAFKLKYQVKDLQHNNEVLRAKVDQVLKEQDMLAVKHSCLLEAFHKVSSSEQQLSNAMLSLVKERDELRSNLRKMELDREEMALIFESYSAGLVRDDDRDDDRDDEEAGPSSPPGFESHTSDGTTVMVDEDYVPKEPAPTAIPKTTLKRFRGRGSVQFYKALEEILK